MKYNVRSIAVVRQSIVYSSIDDLSCPKTNRVTNHDLSWTCQTLNIARDNRPMLIHCLTRPIDVDVSTKLMIVLLTDRADYSRLVECRCDV
jgi:hypothetical protein